MTQQQGTSRTHRVGLSVGAGICSDEPSRELFACQFPFTFGLVSVSEHGCFCVSRFGLSLWRRAASGGCTRRGRTEGKLTLFGRGDRSSVAGKTRELVRPSRLAERSTRSSRDPVRLSKLVSLSCPEQHSLAPSENAGTADV